jgi:biotin synthase-like enzyme
MRAGQRTVIQSMRNASAAGGSTAAQEADRNSANEFPSNISSIFWNRVTISAWLQVKGDPQQRLFAAARQARRIAFGDRAIIRGLMEVTNLCRINCEFCPMRRDNTRRNTIFELSEEQILATAAQIKESGINIVFLQAGEVKKTTQIV